MALSNYEKQKRWREKHRALYNLQQRNRRKKDSSSVEKEAAVESNLSRTKMACSEIFPVQVAEPFDGASAAHAIPEGRTAGSNPATGATKDETLAKLREMVKQEQEKPTTEIPVSAETRSVKDVVGGIYRNDNGGVISKFAWEKLQKMKAHAKENNFEIDEYSQ